MTVCDSSASNSAFHVSSSGAHFYDAAEFFHPIELIRPPAHHPYALLPELGGMGVGATDFIRFLMRKLTLDRIRMPLAAFVQQNRRRRSKFVDSELGLIVSDAAQRRIQRVVADGTMPGSNGRKQQFRASRQPAKLLQDGWQSGGLRRGIPLVGLGLTLPRRVAAATS